MTSVLIDASNLHHGGGVQVAASFLDEVARLSLCSDQLTYEWLSSTRAEVSSEVWENLAHPTQEALTIDRVDRRPLDMRNLRPPVQADVTFTVFGPAYGRARGRRHIVGFADVTSIYPRPRQLPPLPPAGRFKSTIRRRASRFFAARADRLVVEAPHVKNRLMEAWGLDASSITVVSNCVNGQIGPSRAIAEGERSGWVYVSRFYPHKNFDFLGRVGESLASLGHDGVHFTVTLTGAEWAQLDETTRRHCRNVGPMTVDQLSALYGKSEGAVFPSLLECFSAMPLEALACGLPLVASDRPFVRDLCADAAVYCSPEDPEAWARAIIRLRTETRARDELVRRGRLTVSQLPGPKDRALAYLSLIDEEMHLLGS